MWRWYSAQAAEALSCHVSEQQMWSCWTRGLSARGRWGRLLRTLVVFHRTAHQGLDQGLKRLDSVNKLTQKHSRNHTQGSTELQMTFVYSVNGFLSIPIGLNLILIWHLYDLALVTRAFKLPDYEKIPKSELSLKMIHFCSVVYLIRPTWQPLHYGIVHIFRYIMTNDML